MHQQSQMSPWSQSSQLASPALPNHAATLAAKSQRYAVPLNVRGSHGAKSPNGKSLNGNNHNGHWLHRTTSHNEVVGSWATGGALSVQASIPNRPCNDLQVPAGMKPANMLRV